MSITDQQMLSEIQALLLEPRDGGASFPTGLWSASEAIEALDAARRAVLLASSAVIVRDTSVVTSAGVTRYTLPDTLLSLYAVAFDGVDGRAYALSRSDTFLADRSSPHWPTTSGTPRPVSYTTGELPSLAVEVMPAPNVPGRLDILATSRPADLTGAGASLGVPDELTLPMKWRTVQTLLAKTGRSASPTRAAYAGYRAQEMEAALTLMLEGWS